MKTEREDDHAGYQIGLAGTAKMRASQLHVSSASWQQVLQRLLQDRSRDRVALQLHAQGLSSLI